MGAFGGLILTNKGRNLQVKAQTGVELHFTRIAIGDGDLGGSSVLELNALKNERKSLEITKLKVLTGGQAVVGSVLNNQDITAGFYFREIGVFATDPDVGEILYCYANAGSTADYIPAGSGGSTDLIEKTIDIVTLVGNAANVTATINESLIYETPERAQEKADQAEQNAKEYADQQLAAHSANTTIHITSAERTAWNQAESNAKAYTDQQLATHTADSTTGAHKAKNIAVEDANNHFTGTDVESVLNELFTFANDGKTAVANAITAKGVSADPTETFASLATKIGQISTGKKWAVVSVPGYSKGSVIPITGLGFRPSICIFRHTGNYGVGGSYIGASRGVTVTTYGTTHYSVFSNVSGLQLYLRNVTDDGCDVYVGGDGSSFDMLSVSGTAYLFS